MIGRPPERLRTGPARSALAPVTTSVPWAPLARLMTLALAIALGGLGCSGHVARFTDGPVVTRIDDDADVGEVSKHGFWRLSHHFDDFGSRQARLTLDPVPAGPARDVNRLGEVPSSTWYENRIDRLTPDDVARGPGGDDPGPEAFTPWTITGVKIGGRNPGLVFDDVRGVRYICKFDKIGSPVIATAAGAVASRLFWALGYHVPDDRVVIFERSDLVVGEEARVEREDGGKRPLTDADVDAVLAAMPTRTSDGRHRALVSRFLDGRPMGGYSYAGTRGDDPNDVIPHQDRRSLRGLRVFGAWLQHVDLKIDNTLDLLVAENDRRFLRHHLVDFDGCLGGYWAARHEARIGFAYEVDLEELFTGLPFAGLRARPYEWLGEPASPLVGLYESERYDPGSWKPNYLNDHVNACRPADAFWAGTVLARVTDEEIEAAVTAARFGDPAADSVLTRVLIERRDHTARWALGQVAPVIVRDDPYATDIELVIPARDALREFGLSSRWRFNREYLDGDGRRLPWEGALSSDPTGRIPLSIADTLDYLIVRWIGVTPRGRTVPPTEAHYLRNESGWHFVGVLRDGQ